MRLSALVLAASFALGCGHGTVTWTPSLEAQSKEIQPTPQDEGRALLLDGVKNGRDLGGLAGMHSVVPTGQFFRTASTSHATERDKAVLLARGIVADVDLRTYWEALASPDALAHDPRFHYERVSLFGFGMLDWLTFSPDDRGTSYIDALANHQSDFRKVFHALASQPRGGVLFHCASGKDRTGIQPGHHPLILHRRIRLEQIGKYRQQGIGEPATGDRVVPRSARRPIRRRTRVFEDDRRERRGHRGAEREAGPVGANGFIAS